MRVRLETLCGCTLEMDIPTEEAREVVRINAKYPHFERVFSQRIGNTYSEVPVHDSRITKAFELLLRASSFNHTGHFDRTGQWGDGCPVCNEIAALRDEAEKILKEVGINK